MSNKNFKVFMFYNTSLFGEKFQNTDSGKKFGRTTPF